jgi:hypothetical protein
MPSWINTAIGALATAFVGVIIASFKNIWRKQKAENEGLQALLHDRIFSICGDCENKGYATIEEKRNLQYLYDPYHALGGNGTGTNYYKQTLNMPDKPAERG